MPRASNRAVCAVSASSAAWSEISLAEGRFRPLAGGEVQRHDPPTPAGGERHAHALKIHMAPRRPRRGEGGFTPGPGRSTGPDRVEKGMEGRSGLIGHEGLQPLAEQAERAWPSRVAPAGLAAWIVPSAASTKVPTGVKWSPSWCSKRPSPWARAANRARSCASSAAWWTCNA